MKKQYLLAGLLATALSLTACNEDYTDWADPQSNPQEETVAQVVASFAAGANATIVMDQMNDADSVEVLKYTSSNLEGGTFVPQTLLVNGSPFAYGYTNGSLKVSLASLDSLAQHTYNSRAAVARNLTVKTKGVAIVNGQALTVESNETSVSLTPATPLPIDPNGYHIIGNFTNNWAESAPMEKVGEYLYQYEFTNEGGDQYFKIQLGSYLDYEENHVLGSRVDGDDAAEMFAVWDNPQAPKTSIKGKVIIQLDVANYRIKVIDNNAPEQLFMTGSAYNWGGSTDDWKPFVPVNGTKGAFWGIYYFAENEEVKFAPQAGWGKDFGFDAVDSQASIDRAALSNNGGNIQVGKAGWYLVYVSVVGDTRVVAFEEPAVYLIGGTIGGWDAAMPAARFEVPATADGAFVSPVFVASDEIRAYVSLPQVSDWWRAEFMVFDGKIVYRGNGGDQERVRGEAGQQLHLNFGNGNGSVK